jgi:Ca2+/Na+ antiporter
MILSIIQFQSKSWENFFYFCFFISLALLMYKLNKWNVSVRRKKHLEEVTTKSNIIQSWMFVIFLLLGAFICLLELIFNS